MAIGAVLAGLLAFATTAKTPPSAFARTPAQTPAAVTVGNHTVGQGQTIMVAVRVADVEDLYAADIGLSFDPTIVAVVDANPAEGGVQSQPGGFLDRGLAVRNEADAPVERADGGGSRTGWLLAALLLAIGAFGYQRRGRGS